jgi:hypothetical protein
VREGRKLIRKVGRLERAGDLAALLQLHALILSVAADINAA